MVEYGSQSGGSVLDRPQSQAREQSSEHAIGSINALPFLEAFVDATGEDLRLIDVCNWQGHSLAGIAVNQRGKLLLGAAEEFTVIDARAVPNPALTQLRQRQAQIQQQRGYQQTQQPQLTR